MNADGTNQTQITFNPHNDITPHWQPLPIAPSPLSCSSGGFARPFDVSLTLKKKVMRTIPVKMMLQDGTGAVITDLDGSAPPVVNVLFSPVGGGVEVDRTEDLLPPGMANEDNVFRFDVSTNTWIYGLGTKLFDAPGTYAVTAEPGDVSYDIDSSCAGSFERLE